jgi:signal transduction histidine kinase
LSVPPPHGVDPEGDRFAAEQSALRRVATLVARGAPAAEMFDTVSCEVGRVVGADGALLCRYEADGAATALGGWCRDGSSPICEVGTRFVPEPGTSMRLILETHRPARTDTYDELSTPHALAARAAGWRSGVAAPVIVDGRLWGVLGVASADQPFPPGTEERLAEFTELVASAIANAESREHIGELAEEQAALRRVATLAARGAPAAEVFHAVSCEVGRLVGADDAGLSRFEADDTVTSLGAWSRSGGANMIDVGARFVAEPGTTHRLVVETGRPVRTDSFEGLSDPLTESARARGLRAAVAAPVIVEGRVWGLLGVASTGPPFPPGTEERLTQFTDLVAAAIASTESRKELGRLAEEQAALRRVATLVAQGAPPTEVFAVVAEEVARAIDVPVVSIVSYEPDSFATVLASYSERGELFPFGVRLPLDGASAVAEVRESGRPARIDDFSRLESTIAEIARRGSIRSSVGTPIAVAGRVWGAMVVSSVEPDQLPEGTEERLADFTQLMATAIANAESRAELNASRARIVATADATRRRIERDLHDGAQQQLVSLAFDLSVAREAVPRELRQHRDELTRIVGGLTNALDELREIARGIHPAMLAEVGLRPALKTLARRSAVRVELDVHAPPGLPEQVAVTAYYIVSEALANTARHARASVVHVTVNVRDGTLDVCINDDGRGGADATRGSGLLGLKDRVEAIGGSLSLHSPPGAGTSLHVELPLDEPVD